MPFSLDFVSNFLVLFLMLFFLLAYKTLDVRWQVKFTFTSPTAPGKILSENRPSFNKCVGQLNIVNIPNGNSSYFLGL